MNIASAVKEPALQADFFNEKGLLKEYQPKSMHVLSDLPSHKKRWNLHMQTYSKVLVNFQVNLTKLRLKPDAVPAKHRPRKVPVHLQDAFHEEVE